MTAEPASPDAEHTVPRARNVIVRPRLRAQLDTVRDTPITLMSAPAGSGKTVLAASWLAANSGDVACWVALRPADNDTGTFWRTMVSASAGVLPAASADSLDSVVRETAGAGEEAPIWLARRVEQNPRRIVLVLDNLHEIVSGDVHRGILQLVSQAPRNLRTIALTRHDPPWPLHTMKLDGRLRELRAADLAFDETEAVALFDQMDVAVSPEQLASLVRRTEGWAAGLRLAGLGVASAPHPDQFISEFSGDEHTVAEYLMREVFDRQPAEWQDFLVRIAVVEEVCGDLANALTGMDDGEQRLAMLAESNVFLQELGGRGRWYRLHHLLVDFLNARLTDPRLRRDLHRRAAEWFRSRDMPRLALRNAVAGRQWGLAADLVLAHLATFVLRAAPADLEAPLTALPMEVLLENPGLGAGLVAARVMRGDLTDAELLMQSARAHLPVLSAERRRMLDVVLNTIDIGLWRARGDLPRALEACRRVPIDPQVLATLGLQSWSAIRAVVLGNTGISELWLGDLDRAREHLSLASSGADGMLFPRLNAHAHSALLHWLSGDLTKAAQVAQDTVAEISRAGTPVAVQAVCAYLTLAGVAVDRDELDVADRWLDLADESAIEPHAALAAGMLRTRREAAAGRSDSAVRVVRAARAKVADMPVPVNIVDGAVLLEAELVRRGGNRAEADRLASSISAASRSGWAAVRYRVHAALDVGDATAEPVAGWPEADNLRDAVERNVLGARCSAASGDSERALADLELALTAAAPQAIRRPFLDESATLAPLLSELVRLGTQVPEFAVDLLSRMSGAEPLRTFYAHDAVVMPLTEREGLMLRYLASSLTNVDISRALYISLNTVKTHQRMIYRKLAVNDRRHAVARGRALGLL